MKKLAIGNDHVAVEMKNEIKKYLEEKGYEVINVGTDSSESFNYPISGYKVARLVADNCAPLAQSCTALNRSGRPLPSTAICSGVSGSRGRGRWPTT